MSFYSAITDALHEKGYNVTATPYGGEMTFCTDATAPKETEIVSLDWRIILSGDHSRIWNFNVPARYRRNGIARTVMRTVAQETERLGINEIYICMVQNDGLHFWPRLGATPVDGVSGLKQAFNSLLTKPSTFSREDNSALLAANDDLERTDIKSVWQRVTSKTGPQQLSNSCLAALTEQICGNRTMVHDLTDIDTRQRLGLDA